VPWRPARRLACVGRAGSSACDCAGFIVRVLLPCWGRQPQLAMARGGPAEMAPQVSCSVHKTLVLFCSKHCGIASRVACIWQRMHDAPGWVRLWTATEAFQMRDLHDTMRAELRIKECDVDQLHMHVRGG
jgi:hypothetical protein